jgi:hypothetical protein
MQQATTVRVPATDRMDALEEMLRPWVTTPGISTQCLAAAEEA